MQWRRNFNTDVLFIASRYTSMPIRTNLALEKIVHHEPIPASKLDVRAVNELWKRLQLRRCNIVARHSRRGLVLSTREPIVLLAVDDAYWGKIGRLIKRTGEPWWDFCALVIDSEPRRKHPHAHALSLWRVTAKGELLWLSSEPPESFPGML